MALVAVVAIIANELESGTETQNSPVDVDLPGRYTTTVTTSATRGLTAGSRVDAREGSTVASDAFAGWTEPEPSSGFPFSNSLSSSDSPDSPASPDPPKTRLARRRRRGGGRLRVVRDDASKRCRDERGERGERAERVRAVRENRRHAVSIERVIRQRRNNLGTLMRLRRTPPRRLSGSSNSHMSRTCRIAAGESVTSPLVESLRARPPVEEVRPRRGRTPRQPPSRPSPPAPVEADPSR